MHNSIQSQGTLTLIGSGEMAPSMGRVYRTVMSRIAGSVKAVFLDTPAGFELNADQIAAKAVEYFRHHLQKDLHVASFKSARAATPAEIQSALTLLHTANCIFAGPGSPTYAVHNWRDTVIFEAVARRLASGAHLILASAAAIAMGRYALPVYEIYKVGDAPHWVEGLDLLGSHGFELAIVPHWNNGEGGTHDTRYCFMGEARLKLLECCLPDSAIVLGIDEYTACILDLRSGDCHVMGAGRVTLRRKGRERVFPTGTTFKLDELASVGLDKEQEDAPTVHTPPQSVLGPDALSRDQPPDDDLQMHTQDDVMAGVAPLIDLLVTVRAQLRANKQWALADEIRQRLSTLGIILEDGPTETTWRRE